jgi:hypothetical protein
MADYLAENRYSVEEIAKAAYELIPYAKEYGKIGIPEIVERIREIKLRKINAARLPEPPQEQASKEQISAILSKAGFGDIMKNTGEKKIKTSILSNSAALEKRKEELRKQAQTLEA